MAQMWDHESPGKQASLQASGETQDNEWQVPKTLQLLPHPGLLSHNRAEPGPRVGVSATIEGPRGSRMGLAKGHQCNRGRHCQVVEWQTAPEGLLRRIGGGAQKLSAYAEGRGSEGKQWWVGKKEKETGVGRGDGGPLS